MSVPPPDPKQPAPKQADPKHADPKRPARRLPAWLGVLVAVVAGGGMAYAGWQWLRPTPAVDLSQYESNDARRRPFRLPASLPADGVTLRPDGGGTVQTGRFGVQFLAGDKPRLVARGQAGPAVEDRPLLRARLTALNDAAARRAAKIDDDQVAKLRSMNAALPPAVDAATRQSLLAAWAKLRTADASAKPAAEKAVLDAVNAAAAAHAAATAEAGKTLAGQIKAVLTPEQIAALRASKNG